MRLSELIEELGVLQGVHGDVEVGISHRSGCLVRHTPVRELFMRHGHAYVTNMDDNEIQEVLDK